MSIDHITEVERGMDHIEHVEKYNPYHGSDGRFASAGGGTASAGGAGGGVSFRNNSGAPKWNGNGTANLMVETGSGNNTMPMKITISSEAPKQTDKSITYPGMDKSGNAYKVTFNRGNDGKVDWSKCDILED